MVLVAPRPGSYDPGMTEAIAFDSHRFVKRLTGSGFTEKQAETLAEEHVALLNANLATKADIETLRQGTKADIETLRQGTKADIETLRLETKADIETFRLETKADIAKVGAAVETLRLETKADIARVEAGIEAVKADLLKWMLGAMIAQGGLVVALVKLL